MHIPGIKQRFKGAYLFIYDPSLVSVCNLFSVLKKNDFFSRATKQFSFKLKDHL